jgi:hypothetical protein
MDAGALASKSSIFVARDFETHALAVPLASLVSRSADTGIQFVVPSAETANAGDILRSTVASGIIASARLLAVLDEPNANVCFEIGLALGLGKPVILLGWGGKPRPWLSEPPFSNVYIENVASVEQILSALERPRELRLNSSRTNLKQDNALYLCPAIGEGGACVSASRPFLKGWTVPPTTPYTFDDFDSLFGTVSRVVWTIPAYPHGSDLRDGSETARFATIAGWFAGRFVAEADSVSAATWRELGERLLVLRSANTRAVVDVGLWEGVWKTLPDYTKRLEDFVAGASRTPGATSRETSSNPTSIAAKPRAATRWAALLLVALGLSGAAIYLANGATVHPTRANPSPIEAASPVHEPEHDHEPIPPAKPPPPAPEPKPNKAPCTLKAMNGWWYVECLCKGQTRDHRLPVPSTEARNSADVRTAEADYYQNGSRCL